MGTVNRPLLNGYFKFNFISSLRLRRYCYKHAYPKLLVYCFSSVEGLGNYYRYWLPELPSLVPRVLCYTGPPPSIFDSKPYEDEHLVDSSVRMDMLRGGDEDSLFDKSVQLLLEEEEKWEKASNKARRSLKSMANG